MFLACLGKKWLSNRYAAVTFWNFIASCGKCLWNQTKRKSERKKEKKTRKRKSTIKKSTTICCNRRFLSLLANTTCLREWKGRKWGHSILWQDWVSPIKDPSNTSNLTTCPAATTISLILCLSITLPSHT